MRTCRECPKPAKRRYCSRACYHAAQIRWHRQHYRENKRFNRAWLASNEQARKNRKSKADPNIEREYHQERNFRFGLTFSRARGVSPIYGGLSLRTAAQLSNPRWRVILNGRCVREETWSGLQEMTFAGMAIDV